MAAVGMLALSGYQAYQSVRAGQDAQEAYNAQAQEEYAQAAWARRMGIEEMRDVDYEVRQEQGRTVAQSGKGLRVAGSVKTQLGVTAARGARRKFLINMRMHEAERRHGVRADQLRSAGRAARVAGQRNALSSLLVGGFHAARSLYGHGELQWPSLRRKSAAERESSSRFNSERWIPSRRSSN